MSKKNDDPFMELFCEASTENSFLKEENQRLRENIEWFFEVRDLDRHIATMYYFAPSLWSKSACGNATVEYYELRRCAESDLRATVGAERIE